MAQKKLNQLAQKYTVIRWSGKSTIELENLNKKLQLVEQETAMEKIFLRDPTYLKTSILVMVQDKSGIYPWFGPIEGVKKISNNTTYTRGKAVYPDKADSQAELISFFHGSLVLLDTIAIQVNQIRNIDTDGYYLQRSLPDNTGNSIRSHLKCVNGRLLITETDLQKFSSADSLELFNTSSGSITLGNFSVIGVKGSLADNTLYTYRFYRSYLGYQATQATVLTLKYLNDNYGKTSPERLSAWLASKSSL